MFGLGENKDNMAQQLAEQQQQAQPSADEMNAGYNPYSMGRTDKADVMDKIRPEDVVEKLKHELMGEEWDGDKWVKNANLANVCLTEKGAKGVAMWMLPVSSKNVAFSNLTKDEIKWRILDMANGAVEDCVDNWVDWGVHSPTQLHFVYSAVYSNSMFALKQAQDNGMRRMIQSIITELRSYSNFDASKSGILSGLFKAREIR